MSNRESSAVERAIKQIGRKGKDGQPITAYRAAKNQGLALSTIYRALKRRRDSNSKD